MATPERRAIHTVFIASTTNDLAAHRDAVSRVLESLQMRAIRVDSYGAFDTTPVAVCEEYASKADALVVIIGKRYGWVPSLAEGGDGERSISWLEVDAAERAGKLVFPFILDQTLS